MNYSISSKCRFLQKIRRRLLKSARFFQPISQSGFSSIPSDNDSKSSQKNENNPEQFEQKNADIKIGEVEDEGLLDEKTQQQRIEESQILLNRILQGEVEFNEGDSIEKLVTLDDVFRKREQKISFQLMNLENPIEILDAYTKELARIEAKAGEESPLTADEVALYFYFAVFQKQDISKNKTFNELLNKILGNTQELTTPAFQQLIWSLGNYQHQFQNVVISNGLKLSLAKSIVGICNSFDLGQNVPLAFALTQIFNAGESDFQLIEPIIARLAKKSGEYIDIMPLEEIMTMIMVFSTISLSDASIITLFSNKLTQLAKDLTDEQLQKAINALGELNQANSNQFECLAKEIIERDEHNEPPEMPVQTACSIIFSLSGAQVSESQMSNIKAMN